MRNHEVSRGKKAVKVDLPAPRQSGGIFVEEALLGRRSWRKFQEIPLSIGDASQLLWAAQGITCAEGKRTAPSAGALYPLEVYLVAGKVQDLPMGVYRYSPKGHQLTRMGDGDRRGALAAAALGQHCVEAGPATIVFSAVHERMAVKYGSRAKRYVQMEAGHAVENVSLQAVSLGLGTVVVGAFADDDVKAILDLPAQEEPLCLMPIGAVRR